MIREFSNESYSYEQGGSIVSKGDPFVIKASDLRELIIFLIKECEMAPNDIVQLLMRCLGISEEAALEAVNAANYETEAPSLS